MNQKIGIFCDAFIPENKAVAVRMFSLAEAFHKKGFEVTVHTSTDCHQLPSHFLIKKNILKAPSNESSNLRRLFQEVLLGIEVFFRILFCRYTVVLITSPPFITGCIGSLAARLRGIPYIFDVRDEYPQVYITAGLLREESFAARILLWLEKAVYKNALIVCTVTEGICQRIDEKLKTHHKTVLLRNGFDADLFKPSTEKENVFTVIFHGNIGKFQDPELLLALARKADEANLPIEFQIIGKGNNDSSLKKNVPGNIKYLGMLDYTKVPGAIARAHIGVSFRSNELISKNSFPVKLYEYIGVGIPVIVTPRSEAGDFVEKNGIGFQFNPEELDQILEKIVLFKSDHFEHTKLSKQVASIRESFSRHKLCEIFVDTVKHELKIPHSV